MELKPLGENVVLELLEEETESPGGIILPGTVKSMDKKGIVLATGADAENITVGHIVIFSNSAYHEVALEGKNYIVINYKSLIAEIQ